MRKNNKSYLYNAFIIGFIILYAVTAFISFFHCIQFCLVGNVMWMAVLLSGAFEVGQSLCLASILLTDNKEDYSSLDSHVIAYYGPSIW